MAKIAEIPIFHNSVIFELQRQFTNHNTHTQPVSESKTHYSNPFQFVMELYTDSYHSTVVLSKNVKNHFKNAKICLFCVDNTLEKYIESIYRYNYKPLLVSWDYF